MKTKFSSNDQLCHVFAQQKQESGRGSNLFFENTTDIYSYGYHFLAAKVHETKKGRVVLINENTYSPSTGKQLGKLRSAFRGLDNIKMFSVPVPGTLNSQENIQHFNNEIFEAVDSILRMTKVKEKSTIDFWIENLEDKVKEANDYFSIVGEKPFSVPSAFYDLLKEHLENRLKRTKELDKGLEERQKKALESMTKNGPERLKGLKALWKETGKQEDFNKIVNLEKALNLPQLDLIRVYSDTVITSRRASVPLKTALKIARKLIAGTLEEGEAVEHFTVKNVSKETLKIGCHDFNISEVLETLRPYLELSWNLKLVKES